MYKRQAIVVESGNIENLYSGNAYSGRNVAVNSTSKTIEVDGVTGTVIVSPDTTSIIVDDGNTYLYDTLQDAVDAVDAHGTIYLLKQPSDGKVTVPEKAGFRIVPFDEDSEVDTGKLQLVTASGNKASVDEDGYIVIEQPWIVTLDNGKSFPLPGCQLIVVRHMSANGEIGIRPIDVLRGTLDYDKQVKDCLLYTSDAADEL